MLLEHGADPNKGIARTEYGPAGNFDYIETPYVVVKGIPELSALLLAYGAKPEYALVREQARFRANLKPGDTVQQGLIIEIKSNLVLIQEKNNQRWIVLTELTPKR